MREDQIPRITRNAVGKDSHHRRPKRKVSHRDGPKACVRPTTSRIDRKESHLAIVDAAQLHDRVVARRILSVTTGGLRDALETGTGEPQVAVAQFN